ncbi:N-glycosylase/DNA lyase-like isoform X2 [Anneissia japonica]|uniref:N-glycosylase/DNA lyase-like isoform X2 n=1 Tax=Anneissia japonica TaxID=1529436 RepID=UPI0014255ECF|nr:N-glycosylase/DNA lyase-like isoform X2 [Anneissia japonica]
MDKTVTGHTEVKDMTKQDKDRWKEIKPGVFRSVLAGRVWTLTQADEGTLLYQVHKPQTLDKKVLLKKCKSSKHVAKNQEEVSDEDILRDYFQLNTSLEELYVTWSKSDKHFSQISSGFAGVRTLRIDPTENLFSFICSSNNNISRITGMVNALCTHYGDRLMEVDGEVWYSFPTVASLSKRKVEAHLRELGFGYRAGYISSSADFIMQNGGSDWLESLRNVTYTEAKAELLKLKGVGPKVADCVCLFSLDKTGAIPVDTHVWQISARDYMPKLKTAKSLTATIYKEIGDTYRQMFGEYAGWAHSVLFSADLRKFQELQGQKKHSLEKPDQAIKKEIDESTETHKHSKKLMRKLVTVEKAVVKKIKTEID